MTRPSPLRSRLTARLAALVRRPDRDALLAEAEKLAGLGTWEMGTSGHPCRWSEGAARILGVAPAPGGAGLADFLALVHGEDRIAFADFLDDRLVLGAAGTTRFRVARPDGEVRWVAGRFFSGREAGGLHAVLLDETDRRRAEEELRAGQVDLERRMEARARELETANRRLRDEVAERRKTEAAVIQAKTSAEKYLDISQAIIVGLTPDGRVSTISRRGREILGLPESVILGRDWVDDFVPKSSRLRVREAHARRVAASRPPLPAADSQDEYDIRAADGSLRAIAWHHTLAHDLAGQVVGILSSGIDVTERKQVERTLQESERKFRNLFEYASDAILIVDLDNGRVLDANEPAAQRLGHGRDDLLGLAIAQITAPEAKAGLDAAFRQLRQLGRATFEQAQLRRDGTVMPVEINARLVEYGGHIVAQCIVRDITERKNAEASLLEAKAEAERANTAKSRFLAAASHDLRQPVHAISLFAGSLLKRSLDPETLGIARQLVASVESFETLLNSLLHISRLDAGVLVPRRADFPVGPLIEELRAEFTPQALDKGIGFRAVQCSLGIDSDRGLLGRILRNLLTNALRHTEQGAVLLGCRRHGDHLTIEVHDTGEGVPADQHQAIFGEFYQVGNPERDRHRGLGLGLAIVDRLARLLGHRVRVASEVGRGSCFSVAVPIAAIPASPPPEPEPALPRADLRLDGVRVLVIEDDRDVRDATRMLLESWGCSPRTASTAEEAQGLARDWGDPPDLVISDYRLPGGWTGVAAIESLARDLGAPLKGIVITGDTDPERIREASQAGITLAYKPLRPARLRALITRLVGGET